MEQGNTRCPKLNHMYIYTLKIVWDMFRSKVMVHSSACTRLKKIFLKSDRKTYLPTPDSKERKIYSIIQGII